MESFDAIILGAGACGLMCAVQAGYLGKRVLLLEKGPDAGAKIKISGGGRCNYTNLEVSTANFISENPHFANSTFSQWTVDDTLNFFEQFGIKGQEKTLGQIFPVSNKATDIVNVFTAQLAEMQIPIQYQFEMQSIAKLSDQQFEIKGTVNGKQQQFLGRNVVVATGGFPIPKMGATGMAFDIAKQFDIKTTKHAPALVPMVIGLQDRSWYEKLSGISVFAKVSNERISFEENILFTHWGLSGPAILQISSYWKLGDDIKVNLSPKLDVDKFLNDRKISNPKQDISIIVSEILPKRLAHIICNENNVNGNICELSNKVLTSLSNSINAWVINPIGTEGYRTAEVTLGGIDTEEISSKTMMSNKHPGLFFIGEVVDVTGHLGGYNFQWAWSSGYVAGQYA